MQAISAPTQSYPTQMISSKRTNKIHFRSRPPAPPPCRGFRRDLFGCGRRSGGQAPPRLLRPNPHSRLAGATGHCNFYVPCFEAFTFFAVVVLTFAIYFCSLLHTPADPPSPPHLAYPLTQASSAELVATVIYLLRFKRLYPDAAVSSPHRMFLTTLMLASKFVLDSTYKLSDWAVLGRFFSVAELRRCEAELIHYLDWKLFIRATEYATTAKAILDEAAVAAELAASKPSTSSGKRSGRAAKSRKPATAAIEQGKRTRRRSAALPARTASTAPPQRTGPGDCVAVSIPASATGAAGAATDSAPVIATSA